jgi:hypothetical protein
MRTNKTFVFMRVHSWLIVVLVVFALRLPFLNQAIQGDDPYYLYAAEHAQIDPLHPQHAKYFFQGDFVDMRGFPHPPLNAWILAAPLAVLGDVREVQFHFRYILWSLIAAIAMWSLARRFCDEPLLATLLFIAVPAFVVNGNSFESDLPFLAMWMAVVASFVKAADEGSRWALWGSAVFAALAGLAAYQSVLLTPILGVYAWKKRRPDLWIAILAAPIALGAWQLFELATSGALPAAMLAGYMKSYALESQSNKVRSATALVVHAGWILSPLIVLFWRGARWRWIAAAIGAAGAAIYDPNPLFWLSFACGIFLLGSCVRRGFLGAWVLIFFFGAAMVFFAGSARYLLPIAAPVAILAVQSCPRPVLLVGFALQMALGLSLASVNYQHWDTYRRFAESLRAPGRVWVNAEWGLRWYLESDGALPLPKGQLMQPGDIVASSALALPLPVNAQLARISNTEIRPSIPLRLISLGGRSAYSSAGGKELLPFEISTEPIDRVRADVVVERHPELTSIDSKNSEQIISGWSPDGWIADQVTVILKRPEGGGLVRADIYIPAAAPARRLAMIADGQQIAEDAFPRPGVYSLAGRVVEGASTVTITLRVDKTFSVSGDLRKLGVIVSRIGFH